MVKIYLIFLGVLYSFLTFSSYVEIPFEKNGARMMNSGEKRKRAILLGASIGKAWDFPNLPQREKRDDYIFEYTLLSGFNKESEIRQFLSRKINYPDVIFIKECAAYFPGDITEYKKQVVKWIELCLESKVIPIPTTVVPVTRLHPVKKFMIDILRGRNPFKTDNPFSSKKNTEIIMYNNWIRDIGETYGIPVLDLEKSVRYSSRNRYLREDFARIDGLHINSKAYRVLDKIVFPELDSINWECYNNYSK